MKKSVVALWLATVLVLLLAFLLGGRYRIESTPRGVFKVDRLTGRTWLYDGEGARFVLVH